MGISPVRRSTRPRPTASGSIDESRWTDEQIIDVVGEVMSTVSIQDALAEFRQITTPMMRTLEAPALLKWMEGETGLELQRLVKLASGVEPVLSDAAAIVNYQAQFAASDPRAYAQQATVVTSIPLAALGGGMKFPLTFPIKFDPSGAGTLSFTNTGNRSTPPIFRIYGQCVNPQIVNRDTGERLAIIGTIEDYLEVDVVNRTLTLNGQVRRADMLDVVNSTWFEMPAGTTNLQMMAFSFDSSARLEVEARAAYA